MRKFKVGDWVRWAHLGSVQYGEITEVVGELDDGDTWVMVRWIIDGKPWMGEGPIQTSRFQRASPLIALALQA